MIPDLPDPLGLPRPYGERAPHALRRVARRVHLMGTWHGISRLVRDPVWKAGTASLVSFPLLAGVYQAVTGGAVAIEPSRFPPQSVDMFWAGIAAALATLVYRAACPAAIKEQLRSSEYAGYRPHIVAALRDDVVAAFSELMLEVRLTAEHAAGERLRGRAGEAELIETLLAQGFTPVRYGFGCRELYAVQELAMRVGDAADLPVRASMGRGRPFEPVAPDLWMLPAQGIDLFHLELALRGPADSATEGEEEVEGLFLRWFEGRTDIREDHGTAPFRERRKSALLGVEQLVTPKTVSAVREGIADWLTFSRPTARSVIFGLLVLAGWKVLSAVATQVVIVHQVLSR